MNGLFLFFIPATFAQPESSISLTYKICVGIYVGGRIFWCIFFLVGKEPFRLFFWILSTISMVFSLFYRALSDSEAVLYTWYLYVLLSKTDALEYKMIHVSFYLTIFLGGAFSYFSHFFVYEIVFIWLLTFYFRHRYGVKTFPEDNYFFRNPTSTIYLTCRYHSSS